MVAQQLQDPYASKALKIATFCVGLALMSLGFKVFLLFTILDVLDFVLSAYYLIFGCLICVSELPCCGWLLDQTGFLKYFFGKAVFLCFLGTIAFDADDLYHLVIAIVCFVCAAMYLFLSLSLIGHSEASEEVEKPTYHPVAYGALDSQQPLKS